MPTRDPTASAEGPAARESRPRSRRWLLALVGVLAAPLAWLLVINLSLWTGLIETLVSGERPRSTVHLDFGFAWCVWPTVVHVHDLHLAVDGDRWQLDLEVPEGVLDMNLWELTKRRFEANSIEGSGVRFAFAVKGPHGAEAATVAGYPKIADFPPPLRDAEPRPVPSEDEAWEIDLHRLDAAVERVHVQSIEVDLAGRLTGAVDVQVAHRFGLPALRLDVDAATVRRGDALIADALRGHVDLSLAAYDPLSIEGRAVLRQLSGALRLDARVPDLAWLADAGASLPVSVGGGAGSLVVALGLEDGVLTPRSQVRYEAPSITLVGDPDGEAITVRGAIEAEAEVPAAAGEAADGEARDGKDEKGEAKDGKGEAADGEGGAAEKKAEAADKKAEGEDGGGEDAEADDGDRDAADDGDRDAAEADDRGAGPRIQATIRSLSAREDGDDHPFLAAERLDLALAFASADLVEGPGPMTSLRAAIPDFTADLGDVDRLRHAGLYGGHLGGRASARRDGEDGPIAVDLAVDVDGLDLRRGDLSLRGDGYVRSKGTIRRGEGELTLAPVRASLRQLRVKSPRGDTDGAWVELQRAAITYAWARRRLRVDARGRLATLRTLIAHLSPGEDLFERVPGLGGARHPVDFDLTLTRTPGSLVVDVDALKGGPIDLVATFARVGEGLRGVVHFQGARVGLVTAGGGSRKIDLAVGAEWFADKAAWARALAE